MAWRIRSTGETSDRELEAATRRGTEPQPGIRVRQSAADRQAQSDQLDRQLLAAALGWPGYLERD